MRNRFVPWSQDGTLERREMLSATPEAAITQATTTPLVGETFPLTVTFDNGSTTSVGYGPYVDMVFPATGTNGDDGISYQAGSARSLGASVKETVLTFDATGKATHPLALDSSGKPLVITGTPGNQLVVFQLPFGSVVPGQPAAPINLQATTSAKANLGAPLVITARGGFQYGNDALNNPTTDPSIAGVAQSLTVSPSLVRVSANVNAPEGETATGPNFVRTATISVQVAPGQTITNLDVSAGIPTNEAFLGIGSTGGATVLSTPRVGTASPAPGNVLRLRFPRVVGTGSGSDATFSYTFDVPGTDAAGNAVLNPNTGQATTSLADVKAVGSWTPTDTRDPVLTAATLFDAPGAELTLSDKSLATQMSAVVVNDVGAAGVSPGDTLAYSADFQVSDFFTFSNLVLNGKLPDGVRLDPSFVPMLQVTRNGVAGAPVAFNAANWSAIVNADNSPTTPLSDGSTALRFAVSDQLVRTGRSGTLVGGLAAGKGNAGPTTGRITFRALVLDKYTDTYPSGDRSVKEGDSLPASAVIQGTLLNNTTLAPVVAANGTTVTASDDTAASVGIGHGRVGVSVYAVNGVVGAPAVIKPGDVVTYKISQTLVQGDFQSLALTDYLPLPVLSVADPNASGATGGAWSLDTTGAAVPAPGSYVLGAGDTLTARTGIRPTLTVGNASNTLRFSYGTYDDTTNTPDVIELLVSLRVGTQPMADQLLLTNQVHEQDINTQGTVSTKDAIVQVLLTEPDVKITKGIIGAGNPSATLSLAAAGPVTFSLPGSTGAPWLGVINSSGLAAKPINADVSGVDAGDLVRYAIVLENKGTDALGAFDLHVNDVLPAGMVIPAGGMALSVTDGTGLPVAYRIAGTSLFDSGIDLINPATGSPIAPADAASGKNVIVITYDLQVGDHAQPSTGFSSTATLTHFSSIAGGANDANPVRTDAAKATASGVKATQTLVSTSQASTSGSKVVTGEVASYSLAFKVPEGEMSQPTLVVTIDPGLAFVSLDGLAGSAGLSLDATALAGALSSARFDIVDPTKDTSPRRVTIALGSLLTNANRDNGVDETLTLSYRVVALDSSKLAKGATAGATATATWSTSSTTVTTLGSRLTKSQPALTAVLTPGAADPFGVTTITEVVTDTGDATAFNVRLDTFTLPAGVDYVPGSFAWSKLGVAPATIDGAAVTAGWTALAPGQSATLTFQVRTNAVSLAGQTIAVSDRLAWTSLPGGDATTTANVSAASNGANGPTTVATLSENFSGLGSTSFRIAAPSVSTTIVSTSSAITGTAQYRTAATDLAIGETVTLRSTITLPEVLTPTTIYLDLPATGGMLVPTASRIVSIGSNLSGSLLAVGQAGTLVDTNGDGVYDRVKFVFGTLTDLKDGVTNAKDQIVVELTAQAVDVPSNKAGATPGETSSVDYTLGTATTSSSVDIVEPTVAATLSPGQPGVDSGDTVTYTMVVRQAAGSSEDAQGVIIVDPFTGTGTTLVPGSVTTSSGTIVTGNGASDRTLKVSIPTLGAADVATITYRVRIANSANPGDTLGQGAQLTWSSLPGGQGRASSTSAASRVVVNSTTLAGSVFIDANTNGTRDAGETGLAGLAVTLTGVDHLGGNVSLTTQTAVDGTYAFSRLRPGLYKIVEAPVPAGYADGKVSAGALGGLAGVEQIGAIAVPAESNARVDGYNFGAVALSRIAGVVYVDANNDGLVGDTEKGVGGVTVLLVGTDDLGASVSRSVVTETDGCYDFEGLRPGRYTLTDSQPSGLLDGRIHLGVGGGTAGDHRVAGVVLTGLGVDAADYDFAQLVPVTLDGALYHDSDHNHTFDTDESGIAGGTIVLTGVDDRGNAVSLSTVTDINGFYRFAGLRPGTYALADQTPAGFENGDNKLGLFAGQAHPIDRNGTASPDGFTNIQALPADHGSSYNLALWAADDTVIGTNQFANVVTISGTSGADVIEFDNTDLHHQTVLVNGVATSYDAGAGTTFVIQGLGVGDSVRIVSSSADGVGVLRPGSATYTAENLQIRVSGVASITLQGTSSDHSYLYGSTGSDTLLAMPNDVTLSGPGYSNRVLGYNRVYAFAVASGNDTANFNGSSGDDSFIATPTDARESGTGYKNVSTGFGVVTANGGPGGKDTATLYDSTGDDTLNATPFQAHFTGPGFDITTSTFAVLKVNAINGGNDRATLGDSAGDDTFTADPLGAVMAGPGYSETALGFKHVVGTSTQGGNDNAILRDSRGNDTFTASPTRANFTGVGFDNTAVGFATVTGDASACCDDKDVAILYDSSGNDTFRADPTIARMYGTGYRNVALGFGKVHGVFSQGSDVAQFWDSAGDDFFESDPTHARLWGTAGDGFDNSIEGLARVTAYSTAGGNDQAILHDSAGDDTLVAIGNVVTLNAPTSSSSVVGFLSVEADATTGKNTKAIGILTVKLQTLGTWTV